MQKVRLDAVLVERGLVSSREQGRRLIMAGRVQVAGKVLDKPGQRVSADSAITIEAGQRYVSRGGYKLEAALMDFELDVRGWLVADVGASTGGFTDCLLQHGASHVFAIDVGYGQLAWNLRQDSRVTVLERTNARYLTALPSAVELATIDASFISLELLLPAVVLWLRECGSIVCLIKPQFEAGRRSVGKGGVVRNPDVHRQVLSDFLTWVGERGWGLLGLVPSPLRGPAGNVEFFAHVKPGGPSSVEKGIAVENALAKAHAVKVAT